MIDARGDQDPKDCDIGYFGLCGRRLGVMRMAWAADDERALVRSESELRWAGSFVWMRGNLPAAWVGTYLTR